MSEQFTPICLTSTNDLLQPLKKIISRSLLLVD